MSDSNMLIFPIVLLFLTASVSVAQDPPQQLMPFKSFATLPSRSDLGRTVIESAVEKVTYTIWKQQYVAFNTISAAFQVAVAIVGPITNTTTITPPLKEEMSAIVKKVLKEFEKSSPGIFPANTNYDELSKKVVGESTKKFKPLPGQIGLKVEPFSSLNDFSPELREMVLGNGVEVVSDVSVEAEASKPVGRDE